MSISHQPILAGLLIAASLTGCSATAPPAADPDSARKALERTLQAWVEGKTVASLREATPPITVQDHQWESGRALAGFTISPHEQSAGSDRLFHVVLRFRSSGGARSTPSEEGAEYYVATQPELVVTRSGS
ncbi:MAG: hypothetical protein SFX72_00885 [Isosphaeraceae bacterium]|nr:hypothetical protein [Isosphaeraceae bacterium]